MVLMDVPEFKRELIVPQIPKFNKKIRHLNSIINIVFDDFVYNYLCELNEKYSNTEGRPAIPRQIILTCILCCYYMGKTEPEDISYEISNNKVISSIACNIPISSSTIRNFMEEVKGSCVDTLLDYTIVRINDAEGIDFRLIGIDSTDAIARGSKNNKLYLEDIEAIELVERLGLLHDGSKIGQERSISTLSEVYEIMTNEYDKKLIERAIKKNKYYTFKVFENVPYYKSLMEERDLEFISLYSPDSVLMRTKTGKYDFAYNLQVSVTSNNIILDALLTSQTNDTLVLGDVLGSLEKHIENIVKLQKKYGKRRNYKQLENWLKHATFLTDSGYSTKGNFIELESRGLKYLVHSRVLARDEKQSTKKLLEKSKELIRKGKKLGLKQTYKTRNGRVCPMGNKSVLVESRIMETEYNKAHPHNKDFIDIENKYKICGCDNCPFNSQCGIQEYKEKTFPVKEVNDLKFFHKTFKGIYSERFHLESVNAWFKRDKSIIKLSSSRKKTCQVEITLQAIVYNIIRFAEIKGTWTA